MQLLQRELKKKSRLMPTRKLIEKLPVLLPQLKPCMMMSPLTVSSYFGTNPNWKFDIVIFDEATSSLDQANEKIIHETVMSLRKNTTCIIVSHRLTTIEACSHLFWIEQGSIIAEGAPSEILPFYVETMKNKGEPVTDIAQVQS